MGLTFPNELSSTDNASAIHFGLNSPANLVLSVSVYNGLCVSKHERS